MKNFLMDEESGQGMVEYALILALVAVACIVVFRSLGTKIGDKGNSVINGLDGGDGKVTG